MGYKYSTRMSENCARAVGIALPISHKQSIMVCNAVRGLPIEKAKNVLKSAIAMKKPIAFTKFNDGVGHKAGMSSGRYALTACTHILKVLNSAESNAQFKGLSTGNLVVKSISAREGPHVMNGGRHQSNAKRTHVELVLEEVKERAKK